MGGWDDSHLRWVFEEKTYISLYHLAALGPDSAHKPINIHLLLGELQHPDGCERHPKIRPAGEMELGHQALRFFIGDVAYLVNQHGDIFHRDSDIPVGPAALIWPILGTFTLRREHKTDQDAGAEEEMN
ncbi:hypothetical protein E2320_007318 [Naja naja]|nr:hypothetical protein E2320_007318 [Naja naja]